MTETREDRTEEEKGPAHAPSAFKPAHAFEGVRSSLEQAVIAALKTVYDPEIPVDIYDLGLVYDFHVSPCGATDLKMTLTSPACPVAGSLPGDVENTLRKVEGVTEVKVEVTWDPPWTPEMMTDAARLQLGMF